MIIEAGALYEATTELCLRLSGDDNGTECFAAGTLLVAIEEQHTERDDDWMFLTPKGNLVLIRASFLDSLKNSRKNMYLVKVQRSARQ